MEINTIFSDVILTIIFMNSKARRTLITQFRLAFIVVRNRTIPRPEILQAHFA